ncbi:MAG: hypothetical protein WEB00_09380 [Dehalococcoidia bacterium]
MKEQRRFSHSLGCALKLKQAALGASMVGALVASAILGREDALAAAPCLEAVGSVVTVKPGEAVPCNGASQSMNLRAARNEFESFQVVIQAGGAALNGVRVTATALTGPGGTIPAGNLTIYREKYYDVTQPSDLQEGGTGLWPDALIPQKDYIYGETRNAFSHAGFDLDIAAGENRVAWIDVLVPRNQAAGDYSGQINVQADGFNQQVAVELEVLPFALPSSPSLKTVFLQQADTAGVICKAHYGGQDCPSPDIKYRLHALYARAGLENRTSISLQHAPPDYPLARTLFGKYIAPYIKGTSPDVPEWSPLRLVGGEMSHVVFLDWCLTYDEGCFTSWRDTSRELGFEDKMLFAPCDEPNTGLFDHPTAFSDWKKCWDNQARAEELWPGIGQFVTAAIQDADGIGSNAGVSAATWIDFLIPPIKWMDNKRGYGSEYRFQGNQRDIAGYNDWLAGAPGRELWLYFGCESHGCEESNHDYYEGWPDYSIDQKPFQARAMGWLAFIYRVAGEYYWNTTQMLETAWTDQYDFGGNGDGTFFYPGKPCQNGIGCIGGANHIPLESIRLKRLRDAREDYEYLILAQEAGGDAATLAKALFCDGCLDGWMYKTSHVTQAELDSARDALIGMIDTPEPQSCDDPGAILGTNNGETLRGTAGADIICGLGGRDILIGLGGNDLLVGGGDFDYARYDTAPSAINADLQAGRVTGGHGADTLVEVEGVVGSDHNDTLYGDGGMNSFWGMGGNDEIRGLGGFDYAEYKEAPSGVTVSLVSRTSSGGDGNDTLSSIEGVAGSDFADVLTGNGVRNELFGLKGADRLSGGGGHDELFGDEGNDRLTPGAGDDLVNGGAAADTVIYAGATGVAVNLGTTAVTVQGVNIAAGRGRDLSGTQHGNDQLAGVEHVVGSSARDVLVGGAQVNRLSGGGGNDTLQGAGNNDNLVGAAGNDGMEGGPHAANPPGDRCTGGAGTDTRIGCESGSG